MKKMTINVSINNKMAPFVLYMGDNKRNTDPTYHQAWWLANFRGGEIHAEVSNSLKKLKEVAAKNQCSFEELVFYALNEAFASNKVGKSHEDLEDKLVDNNQEKPSTSVVDSSYPAELIFIKGDLKVPATPDFYTFYLSDYEKKSPYRAGLMYENGYGVPIDLRKAFNYFEQGASSDYRCAGKLSEYYRGEKLSSVKKDYQKHVNFLLDAVIFGADETCIYDLCVKLDAEDEFNNIILKIKEDAEQSTQRDVRMLLTLGFFSLVHNSSIQTSIDYFKSAAQAYRAPAAYCYLGLIFERGLGGLEPDLKAAISYYEQANNHPVAMYRLANLYYHGISSYPYLPDTVLKGKEKIEKDMEKATFYLEKSVQKFYAPAQSDLAFRYFNGWGLEPNEEKAVEMAKQAILGVDDSFNVTADKLDLSSLYESIGDYYLYISKDYAQAINHYFYGFALARSTGCLLGILGCYEQRKSYLIPTAVKITSIANYLNGVPDGPKPRYTNFILGKMYFDGRLIERDLTKAKLHLQQSFDLYEERLKDDSDNIDSIAWFFLAQIAKTQLLPDKERPDFYYQKAAMCKPNSLYSRIFQQLAEKFINEKLAAERYQKDAEQGNAEAQFELALCYSRGEGVQEDSKNVIKWLTLSAQQGYINALLALGFIFLGGEENVAKDPKKASEWFRLAAMKGDKEGQFQLGDYFCNVEKDFKEAEKWYQLAADQGHDEAKNKIYYCQEKQRLSESFGTIQKKLTNLGNLAHVVDEGEKSLLEKKTTLDNYTRGINELIEGRFESAIEYLRIASKGNDKVEKILVQLTTGSKADMFYQAGQAADSEDKEKIAFEHFKVSAELGSASGQCALALCYQKGKGVQVDTKEALKWLLLSAAKGNSHAQGCLGVGYLFGHGGLPKNPKEGLKWLQLSATEYGRSQYIMGTLYESGHTDTGINIRKDLVKALEYYSLAENNGVDEAKKSLNGILTEHPDLKKHTQNSQQFFNSKQAQTDKKPEKKQDKCFVM